MPVAGIDLRLTAAAICCRLCFFLTADQGDGIDMRRIRVVSQVMAFILTFIMLAIVQLKVEPPALILERHVAGGGWLEIALLALYAAFITGKLMDSGNNAVIRTRIWTLFSLVFFSQLILGLGGLEKFLMTGELHLPVPAMIIAGPIFRGGGFFMPILFLATLLLVGPAWCSFLCYVGAWDNLAARNTGKPGIVPRWRNLIRTGIFLVVIITAFLFNIFGVPGAVATAMGILFGAAGVGVMIRVSRKAGVMVHCIAYCPIGLLADGLGKLSPFRLRIGADCTRCGACSDACRYDALKMSDIEARRPGITCSLCGDCLAHCPCRTIGYRFGRLTPDNARALFIIIVVSLHAVFMGVARI